MHEKGSRVTDTICLVVERRTGSTRSPYFRLISVMRNTNARVIRMPGMKDKRRAVPYSTMSRLLIEIMSSIRLVTHFVTSEAGGHPTTLPPCAIKPAATRRVTQTARNNQLRVGIL